MGCRRKERLLVENIRNTTTHVCGFCLRLGCGKDFLSKILHKSALSCPLYSLTEMSLRCLVLVAICFVFISTEAVSGGDVKKSLGDEVSFRPDKVVPSITSITWKHIKGVIVVKVIEWDVDDGVSIPNPRFKGITTLDEKTGQITITNLKVEHSGLYTIDINNKEQQQRFSLTVMGGDEKKAVGGTVSFRPAKLGSSITSITWKQIKGGMVVKVIEWDVDEDVSIPNPRFQNITTLDDKTGQITLTNLKVEHSGLYTIDINSKEQQQRFTLAVTEPVPKPVITIEKSSNTDVYLRCGYNGTIIWKNSAGDTLEGKNNHNPGEFITVTNTRNPENFYTCTLKNAVSEETSEPVYERDLFIDGDVKKAVGETVSFRPDKLGSPVISITWKHRNGVMIVKVIDWDVDDGFSIPNPRFQDITTLDDKTGQITITNLKVEHSGLYTIDINNKEQQQRFTLEVMGGDVKKAVGETVSFRPDKLESSITSFTWKQRNGGMIVKVIDWDVDDGFSIPNPRFQDITTLDEKTGQITITNLKVEHSGLYTIDINSKEQQQRFTLTVMERVPKPVITIEKSSDPDVVFKM